MSLTGSGNAEKIWNYLISAGLSEYGAAGLMGNLYAESGLTANNLQNTYNTKLGMTDAEYTAAVDDGSYTKFASDSAGYGLAQWTYSSRKKNMLAYHQGKGKSIGDLETQLGWLVKEMKASYSSVWKTLTAATSVSEASNAVLLKYEKPANTGTSVQTKRAEYGQKYYDAYATATATSATTGTTSSSSASSSSSGSTSSKTATKKAASYSKSLAGTYKTTAKLNMRNGAGTSYSIMVTLPKGTAVQNYGYYTTASGTKWLYVQVTYNKVKYTGFCSSKYLKKS